MHLVLSLSFVGQLTPSFFSLFIIFLIRNFLPLLHFLEHDVQGDQPVTMQSGKEKKERKEIKFHDEKIFISCKPNKEKPKECTGAHEFNGIFFSSVRCHLNLTITSRL